MTDAQAALAQVREALEAEVKRLRAAVMHLGVSNEK